MKASRKSPAGFSLVELVIALGVTSFCLLSIMGLLVVGLQGTKTTGQQTVAAQIGSDVIADIRSTPPPTGGSGSYSPRFNLQVYNADGTVATGLAVCFLDEQENAQTTVTGPPNSSVYRVTVQLTPPPATNPPQRARDLPAGHGLLARAVRSDDPSMADQLRGFMGDGRGLGPELMPCV